MLSFLNVEQEQYFLKCFIQFRKRKISSILRHLNQQKRETRGLLVQIRCNRNIALCSSLLGTTINPGNTPFCSVVLETPFPTEGYGEARESYASGTPLKQVTQLRNFFEFMVLRIPSPKQTGQAALGGEMQSQVAQGQKVFFVLETSFLHLEAPNNLAQRRKFCLHKLNQHRSLGAHQFSSVQFSRSVVSDSL